MICPQTDTSKKTMRESARDLDSIVRVDILLFATTVYYTHL